MKLVWSPETAAKAYIDTVQACEIYQESGVAELVSAMAAGWNAQLIVETWQRGGLIATSIGLGIASRNTGGRHVCIVSDEDTRSEYLRLTSGISPSEVIVGDAEEALTMDNHSLKGVDFLVVDFRRQDYGRVLRKARLSLDGAVLVRKNAGAKAASRFLWRRVMSDGGYRVVKTAFLPVGKGLDMAHVGAQRRGGGVVMAAAAAGEQGKNGGRRRMWVKHVDQDTGEEHVVRT